MGFNSGFKGLNDPNRPQCVKMESAWAKMWPIKSYTHNEILSSPIQKTNSMTNGTKLQ